MSSIAITHRAPRCSRWAGRCWTSGEKKKRRRGRSSRPTDAAAGLAQGSATGRGGRGGGQEEDPPAQAVHRRHAADGHGDGGQDARRERTLGRDEGDRPGHAGHARRHHRGAAQARLHHPERQESRSHRQGHPADRDGAPRGQEPGDDRPVGGVLDAHPARQSAARTFSERHRRLRARGGGQGGARAAARRRAAAGRQKRTRAAAAPAPASPGRRTRA